MKVLIVAKTRRGAGACVGGITESGKSVRLIAHDASYNQHAGLEYEVGEVWEVEWSPDVQIIPPHVENIIVWRAKRLRLSNRLTETISRFMPPVSGGPDCLFDGYTRATKSGGLYVCAAGGVPSRSTIFWRPDKPLDLDFEGKRIRYRYPMSDGGRTVTFVGFQNPLSEIPADTLLRVSLAHWWRPSENPEVELRCFVQLSGWVVDSGVHVPEFRTASPAPFGGTRPTGSVSTLQTRALQILKNTFGFAEFLPMQWNVIQRVLERKHTLVVMPTGGGKSLCYQLPSLLLEGLTVVVSPLVALMRDQVIQLAQVGVRAACLNHLVALREYQSVMHHVRAGQIRLLYLAPESLLRPETLLLLQQSNLACIAIDEAHCISEWGHDFRPEYRQLAPLRDRFPAAVWVALTATATTRVRQDIRRLLEIPPQGEFVASFNRKNLFIAAERRRDCLEQVIAFLQSRRGQSGIIYCGKKKQADRLCAELNANGWPALTYHAGMTGNDRNRNQECFINDETPIMVATVAFGMGINKSNVRFVLHAHLPKDLESYYQEIGRAGRDGLPASCLLLYTYGDAVLHRRLIEQGASSERPGRQARLQAMLQFAETTRCRRKPLLAYFGDFLGAQCGNCDNCVHPNEKSVKLEQPIPHLAAPATSGVADTQLLQKLKALRKRLADEARVPAFVIFSDRSLAEMTQRLPQSDAQFLAIHGVGSLKLANHGQHFLTVIREHCAHACNTSACDAAPSVVSIKRLPSGRPAVIGQLFLSGQTIEQIAAAFQSKRATVVDNLYRFKLAGGQVNPERVLRESKLQVSQQAQVFETFQRLGIERLAPIFEALSGIVPYEELHLLRLYWVCLSESN